MEDEIEFLEKTLARLLEWNRTADSKVPPILAICTSMLAVVAALFPKISCWTILSIIIGIFAISPLILCLFFLFFATFPRTQGPKRSLCYFEGIKTYDPKSYLDEIIKMTDEQYSADLASQCHRNAEIASIKYQQIKIALGLLFFSVIPWILFIFILYRGK